jgi:hypothetical protein
MVMTQQPSPKIATARFKTVRVVACYVSFKSLDIYREKPNTGRTDGLPNRTRTYYIYYLFRLHAGSCQLPEEPTKFLLNNLHVPRALPLKLGSNLYQV